MYNIPSIEYIPYNTLLTPKKTKTVILHACRFSTRLRCHNSIMNKEYTTTGHERSVDVVHKNGTRVRHIFKTIIYTLCYLITQSNYFLLNVE